MKIDIIEYKKERTVYLTEDIDSLTIGDVQNAIQFIIDDDNDVYEKNKTALSQLGTSFIDLYEKETTFPPIVLIVNCAGGSVYSGLGLYDYIRYINTQTRHKINIMCQGTVASMATIVILASENRVATRNTSFLLHSLSDLTYGKIQDIEDNLAECKRLNEAMNNIYLENTNLTVEQLESIDRSKKDWWFGADKALELNLITKII